MKRSWGLLQRTEKWRVGFAVLLQIFLNFLDLLGVLAISLTTYVVANGKPPAFISIPDTYFPNQSTLIFSLISTTIVLFALKGILAPIFYSRIMRFLGDVSVITSMSLTRKFFSTSSIFLQRYKSQDSIYSLSQGVTTAIVEVLGSSIILISEAMLLLILLSVMLFSNWILCLLNITLFGSTLFLLHRIVGKKIYENSNLRIKSVIDGNSILIDIIDTFREVVVHKKLNFFLSEFEKIKRSESRTFSTGQVLNIIPKYVFEVIFYVGSGGILLFLYKFSNQTEALTLFVLFTTSGSRILPSILRIQASLASIRASQSLSDRTFSLIDDLAQEQTNKFKSHLNGLTKTDGVLFKIDALKFSYSDKPDWNLEVESLSVGSNMKIALVGPSGAGKSTLVDLILGVLSPTEGKIDFASAIESNANGSTLTKLAYMPQQSSILSRSFRENVAFGVPTDQIDDALVIECLTMAGLSSLVNSLPDGIYHELNERGSDLSGGQRQRLGFARAIYQKPNVLILDESTSSLDAESEFLISEAINNLDYKPTVVSIAHRLSTIRDFDLIIYMEAGRILELGTFEEVRLKSATFDSQARRMGL